MKGKQIALIPLFIFLLHAHVGQAARTEQVFLFSAPSLALGGHAIAFANNLSGILQNPAGMYYVDSFQFLASFAVTEKEEYIIHSATAFPLSVYKNVSLAINGAFIQTENRRIQTGAAFGWRMGIIKTGFYGAYQGIYVEEGMKSSGVFRLGFLLTPALLKAGLVIENRTTTTNTGFILREQIGGRFFGNSLQLSVGAKQMIPDSFRFNPNIALNYSLWEFFSVSASYEDARAAAGATFATFNSRFHFAISYDIESPSFNYAVSIDTRI